MTAAPDDRLSGPVDFANAARFYRSDFTAFPGAFPAPQTLVVTLLVTTYQGGSPLFQLPVASVALMLSSRAFPCPNPPVILVSASLRRADSGPGS